MRRRRLAVSSTTILCAPLIINPRFGSYLETATLTTCPSSSVVKCTICWNLSPLDDRRAFRNVKRCLTCPPWFVDVTRGLTPAISGKCSLRCFRALVLHSLVGLVMLFLRYPRQSTTSQEGGNVQVMEIGAMLGAVETVQSRPSSLEGALCRTAIGLSLMD